MMGGGMMDGMTGLVWLWVVVPLLVLMLVVVVSVWLVRTVRSRAGSDAAAARRGLDLRYARGEVDRDEYLQRRADLEESRR
ncbi:MAG TPA: SHOCT domain-containing protein [Actinomycetes bacterium]|nr:SHOCT domain-containing protein [Actinomycetes bacterium]